MIGFVWKLAELAAAAGQRLGFSCKTGGATGKPQDAAPGAPQATAAEGASISRHQRRLHPDRSDIYHVRW